MWSSVQLQSVSGVDSKLGLTITIVRPNLLSKHETLCNWPSMKSVSEPLELDLL